MYWNFRNWICFSIKNPFKTYNQVKDVFKPLTCYFKCGRDWDPVFWYSPPAHIQIVFDDVEWKDKFSTPRFESPPCIWIHLFGFNLVWYWSLPAHQFEDEIDYWEQLIWYLYYVNYKRFEKVEGNTQLEKARNSWPWQDYKTKKSTWNDKFIKSNKL